MRGRRRTPPTGPGARSRSWAVLVPDGSLAEVARARLELLAKDALAADADDVQARRGDAAGGRSRPELGRLLAERARASADALDRGMRQTADSQMADLRAGLLRDLGWLLAVLTAALVLVRGRVGLPSPIPDHRREPGGLPLAGGGARVAPPMVQDVLDTLSDGVLVFDAHGTLLASSPSAAATLDLDARGAGAGKRRGPRRGLYLPSDDAPDSSMRNPLVRAIAGERVEGVEMSVGPPSDPESRRVILSARPLRDPDGTRRGAAVVLRDITDLKSAEAALAEGARGARRGGSRARAGDRGGERGGARGRGVAARGREAPGGGGAGSGGGRPEGVRDGAEGRRGEPRPDGNGAEEDGGRGREGGRRARAEPGAAGAPVRRAAGRRWWRSARTGASGR